MHSLAPQVHGVALGADLVFLDVEHDAYVCLAGAGAVAAMTAGEAYIDTEDDALCVALGDAGLIMPERTGDPSAPRLMAPPAKAAVSRRVAPLGSVSRALWRAHLDAALHYHGRSFAHLVAFAARRRRALPSPEARPSDRDLEIISAFDALWPWIPFQGRCLKRSFMLLSVLCHSRSDAAWVFGVRTYPFEAHCWLQIGETVLDDSLDHLAAYRPLITL